MLQKSLSNWQAFYLFLEKSGLLTCFTENWYRLKNHFENAIILEKDKEIE